MKTNCVVCYEEVDNWDIAYPNGSNVVHPTGGTVFRTYGHYGSGIFDPMDASYLEIVVCDACMKQRMQYTYSGVNKAYEAEILEQRKEQEQLLDSLLQNYKNS